LRREQAVSGTEAVNLTDVFQPYLILSDVIMPDMNGIEAAIIIRGKLPDCKILLLSGQAVTVDLLAMASAQGYEFEILAKPIHPDELWQR
jgi:CheY-like chemotaxis protein